MPLFHPLAVTDLRKTIKDAVVVTLEPLEGGDFHFIQGQYLTFRREINGTEIRRSYSICSGRNEGILRVGIKRVDGGAFSTWANTELEIGETLEAMEPMGRFHAPLEPERAKSYLGFAGGSGITPVLSILRTVLAEEPDSSFTLIYANKGVGTIMFRDEIEDLKNTYMERLGIVHILERDSQDMDLFTGMVTEDKCARLFDKWIDVQTADIAFICGPEPMMLGIAKALKSHGMREEQIKYELFTGNQPGKLERPATTMREKDATGTYELKATIDGSSRTIVARRDMSVLEAMLENSIDAPFACRAGVCSTCMCKLVEGEVEMVANHALEDYEVERGFVLACQSYPITNRIAVDYDSGVHADL